MHASAFDPYRNFVAPGSVRPVDYVSRAANGHLYRRRGVEWHNGVSGRRHGNVTTTRLSNPGYPNVGGSFPGIRPGTSSLRPSTTSVYGSRYGTTSIRSSRTRILGRSHTGLQRANLKRADSSGLLGQSDLRARATTLLSTASRVAFVQGEGCRPGASSTRSYDSSAWSSARGSRIPRSPEL